jgi:predicted phosphoadenosine phosphosulfate sulfurtransferase
LKEDPVVKLEESHTPAVPTEERPTKYMYVSACMKNENREHYRRKIKLILIDHFHDQGIPYERYCDETDEEEKDEAGGLGIKRDQSAE